MNPAESISELGNFDLRNAATVLKTAAEVLRNLPRIQAAPDTKEDLYQSARLAVESVRIVLTNVSARLSRVESQYLNVE